MSRMTPDEPEQRPDDGRALGPLRRRARAGVRGAEQLAGARLAPVARGHRGLGGARPGAARRRHAERGRARGHRGRPRRRRPRDRGRRLRPGRRRRGRAHGHRAPAHRARRRRRRPAAHRPQPQRPGGHRRAAAPAPRRRAPGRGARLPAGACCSRGRPTTSRRCCPPTRTCSAPRSRRWRSTCWRTSGCWTATARGFEAARQACLELPLGAGAAVGLDFDLDREAEAADLGFERVAENSLDAVANRDFVAGLPGRRGQLGAHISAGSAPSSSCGRAPSSASCACRTPTPAAPASCRRRRTRTPPS